MPNASGRRYKQALNEYRHLARRQRPNYSKRDAAASASRLASLIATERRIAQAGRKKK